MSVRGTARVQLRIAIIIGILFWAFTLTHLARKNWDGDLRGFPLFDVKRPADSALLQQMPKSPGGYDGQFYAILATDPFFLDPTTAETIASPTFRGRRIFLPMAAWVLSGFGDSRAVVVYIFLTWLGTLAAIVITGRWLIDIGAAPLWTLPLWLNAGVFVSMSRALLDPAATALVLLTLVLWHRQRFALAPWVAAAATLTRETALLVAPAIAFDAWHRHRRKDAALSLAIPAGLLVGWLGYLGLILDRLPQLGRTNFWWPFGWLPGKMEAIRSAPPSLRVVADSFATLSVLVAFALGAALLLTYWRDRRLPNSIESGFLGILALGSILSPRVFSTFNHFSRILLPLPFLALLIGETMGPGWPRRLGRTVVLLGLGAGITAYRISF